MKLVAIMGSPHGMKGNTGQVLEAFVKAAEGAGAEVTTFLLCRLTVRPCTGCDACHKTGKCAIGDDFDTILDAMKAADAVVLASPNYIFSVSAQMNALLDRCCGPVHLMQLEGKYGAALVTSGGGGCEEVEDYMLRFLRVMGCWTVGSMGVEAFKLFDPTARDEALEQAGDLAKKVVAAQAQRQTFPEQEPDREAFTVRMRELVTMMKDRWPYEYEYWRLLQRL
jgi:multimeric flavodoxin WrbA